MNPCYKCEDRYSTCHVDCPKYNDWLKLHNEKREMYIKDAETERLLKDRKYDVVTKIKKGRWK